MYPVLTKKMSVILVRSAQAAMSKKTLTPIPQGLDNIFKGDKNTKLEAWRRVILSASSASQP